MSAPLIDLAEQLKDLVNTTGAFTPALAAERNYQPFFELPDLTTLKTTVIPVADRTIERCDRGAWKHELTLRISVQKKLADDNDSSKDVVVNAADAVCEYIKAQWPESSDFELMAPTVNPLFQNALFQQNRLFSSSVELTFWHYR